MSDIWDHHFYLFADNPLWSHWHNNNWSSVGALITAKQLPCLEKSPTRVGLACGKGKASRRIRHDVAGLSQCSGQGNTASISSCTALSTTRVHGAVHCGWLPCAQGHAPRHQYMEDPSWRPNPHEFQPERFLTSHKDVDVRGQHFEFIPFGSGRRICPGIFLSLQVMQLALASLIHGFDLSTISNDPVDMSESSGLTNLKATPLEVLLHPRLSSHLYG